MYIGLSAISLSTPSTCVDSAFQINCQHRLTGFDRLYNTTYLVNNNKRLVVYCTHCKRASSLYAISFLITFLTMTTNDFRLTWLCTNLIRNACISFQNSMPFVKKKKKNLSFDTKIPPPSLLLHWGKEFYISYIYFTHTHYTLYITIGYNKIFLLFHLLCGLSRDLFVIQYREITILTRQIFHKIKYSFINWRFNLQI